MHKKGQPVVIDKEHDDHDLTLGVVADAFIHTKSQRTIYTVVVGKAGEIEQRHFNEENLRKA